MDSLFGWLYNKVRGNSSDETPYTEYQQDNETSTEFQQRILREKLENEQHSKNRLKRQLSDPDDGLAQANLEQSRREGLINEEEYKRRLSDLRKKQWRESDNYELIDGAMQKMPKGTEPSGQPAKPRKTKTVKEWKLIDGTMQEITTEIEID